MRLGLCVGAYLSERQPSAIRGRDPAIPSSRGLGLGVDYGAGIGDVSSVRSRICDAPARLIVDTLGAGGVWASAGPPLPVLTDLRGLVYFRGPIDIQCLVLRDSDGYGQLGSPRTAACDAATAAYMRPHIELDTLCGYLDSRRCRVPNVL